MKRWLSGLVGTAVALSAQANLLINGDFESGFVASGKSNALDLGNDSVPTGWSRVETFTGGIAETAVIGPLAGNGPSAPGLAATLFTRSGDNASGDWTAVQQGLAIDVASFNSLTLSLDVFVIAHNLEAGGWVSPAFEWPLTVQISYTTTGNANQIWRHGWYLSPPGDNGPSPINDPGQGLIPVYNDTLVTAGVWTSHSFNLLSELPQARTIDSIVVGGSGWNYESAADNIMIVPEPQAWALLTGIGALAVAGLRRWRG